MYRGNWRQVSGPRRQVVPENYTVLSAFFVYVSLFFIPLESVHHVLSAGATGL